MYSRLYENPNSHVVPLFGRRCYSAFPLAVYSLLLTRAASIQPSKWGGARIKCLCSSTAEFRPS